MEQNGLITAHLRYMRLLVCAPKVAEKQEKSPAAATAEDLLERFAQEWQDSNVQYSQISAWRTGVRDVQP